MKCTLLAFLCCFMCHTAHTQQTILWEVTDTLHHKKSYLLGTYHHIGNSFVDSIPAIKKALLQSELAIFETIEDGSAIRKDILNRPSNEAIEKGLNPADFAALKKMAAVWEIDVYKLSPIELLLKLYQKFFIEKCKTVKPTDTWDHFDNYLIHLAQTQHIPLLGLETDSLQLSMMTKEMNYADWKAAADDIGYWINKLADTATDFDECKLSKQYQQFLLEYDFDESCEDDLLVKKRNKSWMETLPNLMSSKHCFIAVGFLHLTKACGLLSQLQQKGFVVKPISLNIPNRLQNRYYWKKYKSLLTTFTMNDLIITFIQLELAKFLERNLFQNITLLSIKALVLLCNIHFEIA